jgi:hypothetical protein
MDDFPIWENYDASWQLTVTGGYNAGAMMIFVSSLDIRV